MKTSNSVVGKCQYCEDPVYKFQADVHNGCAKIEGIREFVEWMGEYYDEHSHCFRIADQTVLRPKLKELGLT